ncbi:hypothetical protein N7517_008037 [Penicillium concentricum]|uniref:Uncharacterized protein n=1 Tax=Penicillium concentricum TaxID=293559 RepID=A0A9W9RS11_9EURO|nr:uncharacterized protein N7517_008037 [Penicillium concentricum]KAJ5365151.1 hypothetical protein N7517_008037 [Penicillium concentricum]
MTYLANLQFQRILRGPQNKPFPRSETIQRSKQTYLSHDDHDSGPGSLAAPINRNDSLGTSVTRPASESDGPCQAEYYSSIIRRLAWLEHSRRTNEEPLTIDVVMAAEWETRLLKEQWFTRGRDIPKDGERLSSRCSSLMALTLLTECVVSPWGDIFHTTWPINSSPASPSGTRNLSAQQSTARFGRSIRDTFDRNFTCPVPKANCDQFLGIFRLGNEAKPRAMRWILRRWIRKLSATLVDMKRFVGPRGVMQRSEKQIDEDLHHRVEFFQGRVELVK